MVVPLRKQGSRVTRDELLGSGPLLSQGNRKPAYFRQTAAWKSPQVKDEVRL